jgi:hypothetical protein
MGNRNSGNRWRYGTRTTTEEMRSIDVRRWAREGMLQPGYRGGWKWSRLGRQIASIHMRAEADCVFLTYRHRSGDGEWKDEEYPVAFVRTACHLGGSRVWFLCPARGCGRRVAILYGGAIFACRRCHQLAYDSTRENAGDRSARRADHLRLRLGWEPGILNGGGAKPKWMHWRTFHGLVERHDVYVNRSMVAIAAKFGFLHKYRLPRLDLPERRTKR